MATALNELPSAVSIVANWLAFTATEQRFDAWEHPLFTDAHLVGEDTENLGPYELLNTIAGGVHIVGCPAAVLRIVNCLPEHLPRMEKTDTSAYHGGTIDDEVAALVSLELGIRLKSGSASRWFRKDADARGTPIAFHGAENPYPLLETRLTPRIPSLTGQRNIGSCARLRNLPSIDQLSAAHLVKAARLYQEATWVSDVDPNLSWLLLIGAVETAANRWRSANETSVDRLRASKPELEAVLLAAGGNELVARVADLVAPYMGSTKKFLDFLLEFAPQPPEPRPPAWQSIDWLPESLSKLLRKVYDYRSRALHDGTPFPYPMTDAPFRAVTPTFAERPIGLAAAGLGGVWVAEDLPMVLATFHHLARGALLNWWDALPVVNALTRA